MTTEAPLASERRSFLGSATVPAARRAVTVGNFDGVHLGHRALLDRLTATARDARVRSAVLTFDPAPIEVLRPELAGPRLQPLADRVAALHAAGVDDVVVEPFDAEFAALPAEAFATDILGRHLGAVAMVVGWDFRFGHGRTGTPEALRGWLGAPVECFGPWTLAGEVVSSSRIRALLRDGDARGSARLLGRPHRLSGPVVRGDARGRTIGFPTANLEIQGTLLPAYGVYAVRTDRGDGVMNLGVRPTFAGTALRIEVHLLDFTGDLYGEVLGVDVIERLRGEARFDGIEALVAQIRRDVDAARAALR